MGSKLLQSHITDSWKAAENSGPRKTYFLLIVMEKIYFNSNCPPSLAAWPWDESAT